MTGMLRCEACGKAIQSKKDLVVTSRLFFRFLPFHTDCYKKAVGKGRYLGRPINTRAADISLALILAVALFFFLSNRQLPFLVVILGSLVYRIMIWWCFERSLKP